MVAQKGSVRASRKSAMVRWNRYTSDGVRPRRLTQITSPTKRLPDTAMWKITMYVKHNSLATVVEISTLQASVSGATTKGVMLLLVMLYRSS